jgi:hypothetical protein
MLVLTLNAILKCVHVNGLVINTHSQDWLTITEPSARDGRAQKSTPMLIQPDPERRTIVGCPMINVGILPCLLTLSVRTGYSEFVSVGGQRLCLKSVTGLTNGSPGIQEYRVESAGQNFVECAE